MNTEIKAKWVAALRSGKYKQGYEFLEKDGKFCCLGVLCDLYCKEVEDIRLIETNTIDETVKYDDEFEILPTKVMKWARFVEYNPEIEINNEMISLAEANDYLKLSFKKIASLIEKQF